MTDDFNTLPVQSWTGLVRVEQTQDGGDHCGFLTEDVVIGVVLGDADDLGVIIGSKMQAQVKCSWTCDFEGL